MGFKCLLCKHHTMSALMVATFTARNGGEHGVGERHKHVMPLAAHEVGPGEHGVT